MDRDCELWLDSEGQLKKEEQAYGSWILAPPFVKGSNPVIKVPGFYEARKQEKQRASSKTPSPISVVVLGSHNSPVVAQPVIEEVEDFSVDSNDRGSNPDKEERFTGGRSAKIREDREEFEEKIAEIDMELNKLEKRNSVGSGLDMDSNLEDVKSGHVTQPVSNQLMHAEARFPYEDQSGSLLSQTLSKQPRVNEAELVSVPITQNFLGNIPNDLDRTNNSTTDEMRKRKKKQGRVCTDENMNSLGSTRAKRLCEEDCSGLPRKKRAVSPYD